MTKIAFISDTHSRHREVKVPADVDILIHAGDLTWQGELDIVADFNAWLGSLDWIKHKIAIAGNHDFCFEGDYYFGRSLVSNATYLQDEMVEIEGIKIYGSPWTPEYGRWAFMSPRSKMDRHWRYLKSGDICPDILVTHGPPYGILDRTKDFVRAGCADLLEAVAANPPKYHAFGHIHEEGGKSVEKYGTLFMNVSSLDFNYDNVRTPRIIDYAHSTT